MITCPICGRSVDHLITLKASVNGYVWGISICPDCLQLKGEILYEARRPGP